MKTGLYFCLALVISGCAGNHASDRESVTEGDTAKNILHAPTGISQLPALSSIDSLEILYFTDPYGDSLRYQRFFTYFPTGDPAILRTLVDNLSDTVNIRPRVASCRSEGKIFAYNEGEVLKTIYFSTNCDSCCHLYFIHNGEFHYMNISAGLKEALAAAKNRAREPGAREVESTGAADTEAKAARD